MKRLLLIFTIIPMLSGSGQQTGANPCNCPVDSSTIPSSIKDSLKVWVNNPVDSFKAAKALELDSLKRIYDSLAVEVNIIHRDSKKKLYPGEADTIRGVIMTDTGPKRDSAGNIMVSVKVVRWYYWRFPDGELRFINTKTKQLPNETIKPSTL